MNKMCRVAVDAGKLWYRKDADGMAAIVSYYMIFAVTPLLLLTVFITSVLYGKELVVSTFDDWGQILGPDMLVLLHEAVNNLEVLTSGYGIPLVGMLFFSGMVLVLFNTFTTGLHTLWDIPYRGVKGWVKKSVRSILFVLVFEMYLLFLIGFNVFISYLTDAWGVRGSFALESVFFVVVTAILFSLAYSILPWESPLLKERLAGGFVASVLFLGAKSVISWYVGTTPVPGLFGAAGLILVLLIWVYVSTSIIYYGAAFAHVLKLQR